MSGKAKYEPGTVAARDITTRNSWFMTIYDAGHRGVKEPTKVRRHPDQLRREARLQRRER